MANNSEKIYITIGRQAGSGGREIGRKVAEILQIPFYDREILEHASKETGYSKELFEDHDEKPTSSFLYSLVMDSYPYGYSAGVNDMPIDHKLFLAQFNTIKKLADQDSGVFVGRCADYALEDYPGRLSVFFEGETEDKVVRVMETYKVSESKAREMIIKTDKKRASYYNYYANKKWGAAASYDLCINSSAFGIEGSVELILQAVKSHLK